MRRQFLPNAQRQESVVAALRSIAQAVGRSLAQAALAGLRYRKVSVIPILGAPKLAQFEDYLASLTLELTPAQLQSLNDASRIDAGFPCGFYRRELIRNFAYSSTRDLTWA